MDQRKIPKLPKWNEPILFFPLSEYKLNFSSGLWKEEGRLSFSLLVTGSVQTSTMWRTENI